MRGKPGKSLFSTYTTGKMTLKIAQNREKNVPNIENFCIFCEDAIDNNWGYSIQYIDDYYSGDIIAIQQFSHLTLNESLFIYVNKSLESIFFRFLFSRTTAGRLLLLMRILFRSIFLRQVVGVVYVVVVVIVVFSSCRCF